ncbi:MAG TPA: class I SAM-dependent methyltransferase [bacterium]|nr:class I SAM-dependent methyltransferase [bacterium]HOM27023.1 class I SAM-dependent methyltransferase [bacterium]
MKKNVFDEVAEIYEKIFPEHIFNYYLNKRINIILKLKLDKKAKILDVGCGTGTLLYHLKNYGYDVWGIDNSKRMVEIAEEKVPGKIIKEDMLNIPFPSETFDLVFSIVSLHHLGKIEKVKKAVREMIRITKNGGMILIWEHNPLNPYWYFLMKKVPQDIGEEKLIPLSIFINEFKKNKIKILKVFRCGLVPDFAPKWSLFFLDYLEKGLQKVFPLLLAHNVIIGKKE